MEKRLKDLRQKKAEDEPDVSVVPPSSAAVLDELKRMDDMLLRSFNLDPVQQKEQIEKIEANLVEIQSRASVEDPLVFEAVNTLISKLHDSKTMVEDPKSQKELSIVQGSGPTEEGNSRVPISNHVVL